MNTVQESKEYDYDDLVKETMNNFWYNNNIRVNLSPESQNMYLETYAISLYYNYQIDIVKYNELINSLPKVLTSKNLSSFYTYKIAVEFLK